MAIKYNAKETEDLEEELEEWSLELGDMHLFNTNPTDDVVKVTVDQVKKDTSKRTTYKNREFDDK